MAERDHDPKLATGTLGRLVAELPWGDENGPGPSVRLEFSGDRSVHATMQIGRSKNDLKEAERQLVPLLGRDAFRELVASEDRLFAWLAREPSHATRFALDPVGALESAGISLRKETVARLQSHRAALKRVAHGLSHLASLRFEVADSRDSRER